MHDWLPRKREYLSAMYRTEGPGGCAHAGGGGRPPATALRCLKCRGNAGTFRCRSCWGRPLLCMECCVTEHHANPFHRIEQLQPGGHFAPASLGKLGITLQLGSKVAGCTCQGAEPTEDRVPDPEDEDESDDEVEEPGIFPAFHDHGGQGWEGVGRNMIVVDVTGIHLIPVRFCRCAGSEPDDIQLLQNELYPSTQRAIRTCFTYAVLDAFLLENVECKTSASAFYTRLQRQTDPIFPHKVPVCFTTPEPVLWLTAGLRITIKGCLGCPGNGPISETS